MLSSQISNGFFLLFYYITSCALARYLFYYLFVMTMLIMSKLTSIVQAADRNIKMNRGKFLAYKLRYQSFLAFHFFAYVISYPVGIPR